MVWLHDVMVPGMVRTQIQLDEATYEALRRRAFEKGVSMSAIAREELAKALRIEKPKKYSTKDFSWIGAGRSRDGRTNIAEERDQAFVEAILERWKK